MGIKTIQINIPFSDGVSGSIYRVDDMGRIVRARDVSTPNNKSVGIDSGKGAKVEKVLIDPLLKTLSGQ